MPPQYLGVFVLETSIFMLPLNCTSTLSLQQQAATHYSCSVFAFWETVGWTAMGRITCRQRLGHQMSQSESAAAGQLQSQSPHLHLTTSRVTVKRDITITVLYIANVRYIFNGSWTQLTKTVHTARLGREFVSVFFGVAWLIFMFIYMYVLFCLGQLSHFPSCFGAGVTNLNETPSSFFALSPLLRVRSWLHPF